MALDLLPVVKSSAGLDVHSKMIVVTLLQEQENGELTETIREFSTFPKELEKLASGLSSAKVELAVMESTGVDWKSIFEALEAKKIKTYVVNAKQIKQIPGKKTDISDSKWLATLARYGLVRGSFIPEQELRHLRLLTRYRVKLKGTIASEINRMHKVLSDAGIILSLVFSDEQSVSAKSVIKGLIEDESIDSLVTKLKGATKKKEAEVRELLSKPLSKQHKFLLKTIRAHLDYLENQCKEIEDQIFASMDSYKKQWEILQAIPGIDKLAAAVIIAEIGIDMQQFETSEKFCSCAGMCPGNNESAGKRKSSRTVVCPAKAGMFSRRQTY